MTTTSDVNTQTAFINDLIKNHTNAVIYLKNGIKLTGIISGHTENVIFLESPVPQMVYKNCVSTVVFES